MSLASPSNTTSDPRMLELQQLQREYRHMEINRRAYAEESQSVLRKQQITIDKLRKDNDGLKSDIAVIMRGSSRMLTTEQQEAMQVLNEQGEKYAQAIEFEKKNIEIMDEQLQIMRQKSLQQRRVMGGVNASRDNYNMIQKQIRILENRLDKSLIKFNESISHNKVLRHEIDDLKRERVVFENIYRKMERELQEKKKQMAEIIELSNQSYEQRDQFQMEIAAIEQANRKEQEEFDEQMLTLTRLLDTELQLPAPGSSLGTRARSVNRLMNNPSESALFPGSTNDSSSGSILPGIRNANSPPKRSKSAGNGLMSSQSLGVLDFHPNTTTGSAPPTAGTNELDFRERAQNFEEAFNKIKAATGIQDIDELVKTFIKNEEHNFSLFNYVNEQNNEIEKYEEQIQQLKEEEIKYAQESGNDVNQHKEILKDLENKLQVTDNMAEKYELRCQDLSRIIESLKHGLQIIFHKLEWDGEDGTIPPTINEINMVNYLGLLEKKAIELLQKYHQIQQLIMTTPGNKTVMELLQTTKETDSKAQAPSAQSVASSPAPMAQSLVTVLGTGPKIPMGAEHIHINPPKADEYRSDDEERDEEDDARPLTRDELKSRTLNRLQKRLASAGITPSNSGPLSNSTPLSTTNTSNQPNSSQNTNNKRKTTTKK